MTVLLDANVLVALCVREHVHHEAVTTWFASHARPFATTPITQGSLLRVLLRAGVAGPDAMAVLGTVLAHERHTFWPDALPFSADILRGVVGHRQVTDAYLAQLCRRQGGRMATLDRGLALGHADVAEIIPTQAREERPTGGG
jgi:hypothetical protein